MTQRARVLRALFFSRRKHSSGNALQKERAVRERHHKLIEYSVDRERRTQLFDLKADPMEMQDLSMDESSTLTLIRLIAELTRWQTGQDDPSPIAM